MINLNLDEILKNVRPKCFDLQPAEPLTDDSVITKAIAMDDLNYYGLIEKEQIMVLLRISEPHNVLLWQIKKKHSDFKPSEAGEKKRGEINISFLE
jgi:hypothetical protein